MSRKPSAGPVGATPTAGAVDESSCAFLAQQDPIDVAAAAWLLQRQEGLDADGEAALTAWLAADPAHGRALAQLEGVWGRLGELPSTSLTTLKDSLPGSAAASAEPAPAGPASVCPASVGPAPPGHAPRRPSAPAPGPAFVRSGRRWGIGRLIGPAFALAVLAGGWSGWQAWLHQPVYEGSFTTARGQQSEVTLPDGSRLWLDTASRAEVRLYRQRREVRLPEGQAQFAVQGDPQRPFDVIVGSLRLTVVGTRFSVRLTPTGLVEGAISVQVEEGRVRVARQAPAAASAAATPGPVSSVELVAGQALMVDPDGAFAVTATGPAGAGPAWREGRVSFDGVPLARALAEFERYGDTRLVIHDPAVAALRVNGSFDLRRLDAFTRALPQVLPVRLRQKEGLTEITATGRP